MEVEEIEARLRKANAQLLRAVHNAGLLTAELARKRHEAGEPVVRVGHGGKKSAAAAEPQPHEAVAAPPKKAKAKKATKVAKAPSKAAKAAAPASAPRGAEAFSCAGNVAEGTPCPGTTTEPAKARTSYEGKLYDSCKECKKAISKSRKEKN